MAERPVSDDELNVVYAAALEFGKNWQRPVIDLAAERLPGRSADFYEVAAGLVVSCRAEVERHVALEHHRLGGTWRRRDYRLVDSWIAEHFPWMSRPNRKRALRQGQYYAHHDGWQV